MDSPQEFHTRVQSLCLIEAKEDVQENGDPPQDSTTRVQTFCLPGAVEELTEGCVRGEFATKVPHASSITLPY